MLALPALVRTGMMLSSLRSRALSCISSRKLDNLAMRLIPLLFGSAMMGNSVRAQCRRWLGVEVWRSGGYGCEGVLVLRAAEI
jgi:hypothetical protein